jgi:hypothetical protein
MTSTTTDRVSEPRLIGRRSTLSELTGSALLIYERCGQMDEDPISRFYGITAPPDAKLERDLATLFALAGELPADWICDVSVSTSERWAHFSGCTDIAILAETGLGIRDWFTGGTRQPAWSAEVAV